MGKQGSPVSSEDSLNTVLLYNCATMAYQTQQLGLALGYLTLILQNLHHFELFLQIKSLFLLLQVLYELRQAEPSGPIITLLEVKHLDLEALTEQKRLIKGVYSDISSTNASTAASASQKQTDEDDAGSQWSGYS